MADIRIGNLHDDTQVRALGEGRYAGHIPESWNIFFAQGGVTMACALRAAAHAVDRPDFAPLSASAVFVRPMPCAAYEVTANVLRTGRSVAHAAADLFIAESGELALRTHAVFGSRSDTPWPTINRTFPQDVPPRSECTVIDALPEGFALAPIWEAFAIPYQFEWAPAVGKPAFAPDLGGDEPRQATWTRLRKTPRNTSGLFDPLAYCCIGDTQDSYFQLAGPEALAARMITLQLDVQWFATTEHDWFLQHTRTTHAADGYVYGDVELWSPDEKLLGLVTQRLLIK